MIMYMYERGGSYYIETLLDRDILCMFKTRRQVDI